MFPIALGPREIVDELLSVDATWKTFESELEAAVHLESVSSVTMARVEPWRSQYANEGYCELGWMSFRISFRMFFFWGGHGFPLHKQVEQVENNSMCFIFGLGK